MSEPKNRSDLPRGKVYRWRDEVFDSVTTIIGNGVPKPALKEWGQRRVAEFAVDRIDQWLEMGRDEAIDWLKRAPNRETDRAAARGSDIHDWARAWVLGQPVPEPRAELRPWCDAFLAFLDDWKPEYVLSEATVYSRTWHYAGTLDFIAVLTDLGPVPVLGDYKTGKGVYGEAAMQLAAYRHADFLGLPDGTEAPMPETAGAVVLHLRPDLLPKPGYQLVPVDAGPQMFRAFLYAQQIHRFTTELSRQCLGTPCAPGLGVEWPLAFA